MTLSRTARILIALLLVAAAAFFWVNFFNQPETPAPLLSQPATVPGAAAADAARTSPTTAPTTGAGGEVGSSPTVESATAQATGTPAATQPGAADVATTTTPVAPAVVTPPTVVLRDLVVDDLPFLVTAPPSPEAQVEADATADPTRPQAGRRGNINPFSPVVVQAPPAPPAQVVAEAAPSREPDVVIVENGTGGPAGPADATLVGTPGAPSATPAGASARTVVPPAPRPLAPAPTRAADLPRPLPSGTLPITPDILRDSRTVASVPSGPANLAEVAAVRVPDQSAPAPLPAVTPHDEATVMAGPGVLGPGRPTAESVTASTTNTLPLVVGADALSRYLRDNDVRFTGTALGPLSVGVFRAKQYDQPVVLTLGQALPDTEIVLADLRGYEAKFSLGNNTQVLSLDIRR
ncbi:MAG: hypothetical protein H3C53_13140 [Trueperaceae bacterium]|nr:hypothetical protein [Trueperaceae bacterium]